MILNHQLMEENGPDSSKHDNLSEQKHAWPRQLVKNNDEKNYFIAYRFFDCSNNIYLLFNYLLIDLHHKHYARSSPYTFFLASSNFLYWYIILDCSSITNLIVRKLLKAIRIMTQTTQCTVSIGTIHMYSIQYLHPIAISFFHPPLSHIIHGRRTALTPPAHQSPYSRLFSTMYRSFGILHS
jgi:hypothetical protein